MPPSYLVFLRALTTGAVGTDVEEAEQMTMRPSGSPNPIDDTRMVEPIEDFAAEAASGPTPGSGRGVKQSERFYASLSRDTGGSSTEI